jgi:hypothetical protein
MAAEMSVLMSQKTQQLQTMMALSSHEYAPKTILFTT